MKPQAAWLMKLPLVLLLSLSAAAQSRVYQWTDSNGVVHYGDSARGPAKSILIKPTSSGINGGASKPAIDEAACTAKREQLKRYSSASRVTETNALGETRDYDDAQIKKLIETSEAAVRTTCGDN